MKTFVKAMEKIESAAFQYLASKFPNVSAPKLKEETFVGPQV